jgi:cytochrome c oxidase subunit 2
MKRWIITAVFVALCGSGFLPAKPPQNVKEVEMTAKKYEFSPSTLEVPAGTLVRFKITALDREHGFEIEGVKDSCVKLEKDKPATYEYKAEKPGTYEFKCCKRCGMSHGKMKGTLVVK